MSVNNILAFEKESNEFMKLRFTIQISEISEKTDKVTKYFEAN